MSTLPKTMRAAAIDHFGGPEVLSIHTLPVPEIDAHEVLIAMHTAGVGIWDAEMRAGKYAGGSERFPLILGTDGSGTVVAVGSRIRRFKLGDLVYAYVFENPKGGCYAEYVAAPAENVGHIPDILDLERAGAIPTTGLTALQGIDEVLHVRKGESVVIHGASGGVGTIAVQFAKLRAARVFATASGKDGVSLVRTLGADFAVDGRHDDITVAGRRFEPSGIDALLGLAGGDGLERSLDTLRAGGRAAYPNGVEPEPSQRPDIDIKSYDAVASLREFERLNLAVLGAKLQVPIAAKYPLPDAAGAHVRLAAGHVLGKIVLRI